MQEETDEYTGMELSNVRQPGELYRIWTSAQTWYYTNGDVAIVYDGHTYEPATIKRGSMSYDSNLEVSKMSIEFSSITVPATQFIARNPINIAWIEVSRVFRDQSPYETSVIFVGQIKGVSFKGPSANAECVGFELFLKMPIPVLRYQLNCNHKVFSTKCGLSDTSYKVTATVTVDATKTVLISATFATKADHYFRYGYISFGGEYRSVVKHIGQAIILNYAIDTLVDGSSVIAYAGCDGKVTTCRDKFDNVTHFLGFPWIPVENPALRI